jgi:hypothetical protein
MEKYTATAAEETTDAKPELVAHVAKTLDGVSTELAGDLVAGVKDADVIVLANDSASMGTAQDEWRWRAVSKSTNEQLRSLRWRRSVEILIST